jgi:hypothetical protein
MTLPGSVNGTPALTFLRDFANRHVRSLDDSSAPCTRTFWWSKKGVPVPRNSSYPRVPDSTDIPCQACDDPPVQPTQPPRDLSLDADHEGER